jgi:hypothetical protein
MLSSLIDDNSSKINVREVTDYLDLSDSQAKHCFTELVRCFIQITDITAMHTYLLTELSPS